jgi:hypothetical protein
MIQPRDPYPVYWHQFTPEFQKELEDSGRKAIQNGWVFDVGFRDRLQQCASILLSMTQKSNAGETLKISTELNSELMNILQAACYLINSTSFREGKYFDFDKDEVNRKLRRKE